MKPLPIAILGVWLAAVAPLLAVTPAAKPGAGPVPAALPPPADYSKGFQKLCALGLPDAATGTYVKLQLYSGYDPAGYAWDYELKMRGNGWLLRQDTNGQAVVVAGQARTITVWDSKALSRLRRQEALARSSSGPAPHAHSRSADSDTREGATWKAVDFTNDLARALAYVAGPGAASGGQGSDEGFNAQDRERRLHDLQGPLFLLATHAWRRGYTNEANRLAGALFAASGDPRKVILAAVDHLAGEQYREAYARFSAAHDWSAYQSDLASLLQRYPQGWRARPGLSLLASNVARRVAGTVPPVAGEGLGEADQALASDLARATALSGLRSSGGSWLLQPADTNTADDVVARLTARGLAGIPLLASLATDEWLLPVDRSSVGRSYYASSESDEESQARQAYDQLERPLSRGDIALMLIRQVIPAGGNQYELMRKPADDLAELAREFYRAHAKATPLELARLYFAEGDSEQRQAAIERLLASPNSSDVAMVETELSDSGKVSENMQMLSRYVEIRGPAARQLVAALAADMGIDTRPKAAATNAAATNATARAADTDGEDSSRGYYRRQIRALLALTSDQSVPQLLAELESGKGEGRTARQLMMQRLGKGDRQATLGLLLDAAVKSTNADFRTQAIGYASALRNASAMYGRPYPGEDAVDGEGRASWKPDLSPHRALWAALLADERNVFNGEAVATVAQCAAHAIETLYDAPAKSPAADAPEIVADDEGDTGDVDQRFGEYGGYYVAFYNSAPSAQLLQQIAGSRGRAFVLARARARLAGTDAAALPAWPSVQSVTAERRKALSAALADPDKARKTLAALTLEESLWLTSALVRNTNLSARLAPFSLPIADVVVPAGDPEAAGLARTWRGRQLDRSIVEALIGYCKAKLAAGAPTVIEVHRQAAFDGVLIRIESAEASSRRGVAESLGYISRHAGQERAVVASLDSDVAVWPLNAGASAAAPASTNEVDRLMAEALAQVRADTARSASGNQERFWKAVARLSTANAAGEQVLWVIGTERKPSTTEEADDGDAQVQALF